MKEINNNLIDGTDGEIKEGVLKNTENALNVSFAKNASDEKLLKVKDGKFGFSFRLFEPGFTSLDILEKYETESDKKVEAEVPAAVEKTEEEKNLENEVKALETEIVALAEENPTVVEEKEKEKVVVEEKIETLRTARTLNIEKSKKEEIDKSKKNKTAEKKNVQVKKKKRKNPYLQKQKIRIQRKKF